MQKQIYLILLFLALPLLGFAQNSDLWMPIDPKPYNGLNGEVDSICIHEYSLDGSKSKLYNIHKYVFDKEGRTVSEIYLDPIDEKQDSFSTILYLSSYNDAGLLCEKKMFNDSILVQKEVLVSAKPNERVVTITGFDKSQRKTKQMTTFMKFEGRKIETVTSDSTRVVEMIYDEEWKEIMFNIYVKDDNQFRLRQALTKEYNDQGFRAKDIYRSPHQGLDRINLFEYTAVDENNNWTEMCRYMDVEGRSPTTIRAIRKIYYRK